MTSTFAIKIFFEIGLVLLIAYGYKNEEKLIAFERELLAVCKFCFRKYVLKTAGKRAGAAHTRPSERTYAPAAYETSSYETDFYKTADRENKVSVGTRGAVIKTFPSASSHNGNVA